jgi:phospholipid-binding lipoprotein MlaA
LFKTARDGWDFILPDPVQRGVHNFFDNLAVVRRVVNNSLQLKLTGAGTELARFGINSTIGVVGFFDVAKDAFESSKETKTPVRTFGLFGAWTRTLSGITFLTAIDDSRWYPLRA